MLLTQKISELPKRDTSWKGNGVALESLAELEATHERSPFRGLLKNKYFAMDRIAKTKAMNSSTSKAIHANIKPAPIIPESCIIPAETCSAAKAVFASKVNAKSKNERLKFFISCLQ